MANRQQSLPRLIAAAAGVVLLLALTRAGAVAPPAQGPSADQANPVQVWADTLTLPTYVEDAPDPNPPFDLFVDRRFNYPYTLRYNLTDRRVDRAWRALNLENEWLKCVILPDLGGHLYSCTDKVNNAQMFYANPSIKYAQIAYRGAWTALGIEFNFPVSHNWMTASPVDFATSTAADGSASVFVGNVDRPYGMQWRVELTLRPGRAVLEQHTTLYNRGDARRRFYWWTNAGVEIEDDSRIIYPMQFTASHGFADVDSWPIDSKGTDLGVVANHTSGPVSRFSHGSREPFMAVYHPRTESGVVHFSSPVDLPSKKIWSWGVDAAAMDWRRALSDNNSGYVEIQAGLFRNQETYAFLDPQESIRFSEYWMPIRQIGGLTRANPDAAIRVARSGSTVSLALNAMRDLPGASIEVTSSGAAQGTGPASHLKEVVSLTPSGTLTREVPDVPAGAKYTVTLRDRNGAIVLQHTEDSFDYTPASEIKTGPQAAHRFPPADQRTPDDLAALGMDQELDGRVIEAMTTYRDGLRRFPDSLELRRAAGRLAVGLKQFDAAAADLGAVLARVSTDREASYYLGVAAAARGDNRRARLSWEAAQQFGAFRAPALFALSALTAREGHLEEALSILQRLVAEEPEATRAGSLEVALLRTLRRTDELRTRLRVWQRRDPLIATLRYEGVRLGAAGEPLWQHLAADPERILEVAVDYMRFGLYREAIDVLARTYPSGQGVVSEPGMPRPEAYPLIAYYRGFCRNAIGEKGRADFDAASRMPTTYVFPNRPETLPVLRQAIGQNPNDATAHFLLGALYLSGGMTADAAREWESARRLNPAMPTLHRNMGYLVLRTGGSPERAAELFREGTKHDSRNVGLYFGLDEALTKAKRPAGERADALLAFPDQPKLPAALVFVLAQSLAEAGRFDEADRQFAGRFFPREEGGVNVRQVYLEVRLRRAIALAKDRDCARALDVVSRLTEPVEGLEFTQSGLDPFLASPRLSPLVNDVRAGCPAR